MGEVFLLPVSIFLLTLQFRVCKNRPAFNLKTSLWLFRLLLLAVFPFRRFDNLREKKSMMYLDIKPLDGKRYRYAYQRLVKEVQSCGIFWLTPFVFVFIVVVVMSYRVLLCCHFFWSYIRYYFRKKKYLI